MPLSERWRNVNFPIHLICRDGGTRTGSLEPDRHPQTRFSRAENRARRPPGKGELQIGANLRHPLGGRNWKSAALPRVDVPIILGARHIDSLTLANVERLA